MCDIDKAIEYFVDAVRETNEIMEDCSPRLQADLIEQKKHFIAAIEALEEKQAKRWIPVSEMLPSGDVASVIIHTKAGGVAEGQYYPSIKAWKQFRWSVEDADVTHWMPLPEEPKGV